MSQGMNALISRAAGTRISLLRSDPLATAHTTGSSRSGLTPVTCCALSARSSPSTPAVFFTATLLMTATSSIRVAISSSRANKLAAKRCTPVQTRTSLLTLDGRRTSGRQQRRAPAESPGCVAALPRRMSDKGRFRRYSGLKDPQVRKMHQYLCSDEFRDLLARRSEERRVGKECRYRGASDEL